jgi:hypothetical protein
MKTKYLLAVALLLALGCSEPNDPGSPDTPTPTRLTGSWKTELGETEGFTPGVWNWSFTWADSLVGSSQLELKSLSGGHQGWIISWVFQPPLPDDYDLGEIVLTPRKEDSWHKFRWNCGDFPVPLPLPRLAVDSAMYSNLLGLIKELTTPYFDQIVTHWPQYPIPVRLFPASNGPVDLAACLNEAADIWNEGEERPWFVIDPDAGWGIRLVHFPDREMHPPLAAQITRLGPEGRPLRIHLLAGNNYDTLLARPYAVRGFVHELGHALFLWGHSLDRIHCLWGLAPPMVSEPSADERKAARWWHGLPDGLDLSRYGIE